jgi:hypothetical protein
MINWIKHLFHREQHYETVVNRKEVMVTTLLRWFLYDTDLADPNEIAVAVGLTPVSAEGETKELEDSKNRYESIEYLIPFLEAFSDLSANVVTTIQIQELMKATNRDANDIEHEIELMSQMYKVLSMATLVAGLGAAFDIGLITQGKVFQTVVED